jgi:hypothetical protein
LRVEAKIRLYQHSLLTIRRSIVVPWSSQSVELWTAQVDSQTGQPQSESILARPNRPDNSSRTRLPPCKLAQ